MKIEITTTKYVKEIIDVEFPYYYKVDLDYDDSDAVMYGKKMPDNEITIKEEESYIGAISYEIERDLPTNCYYVDKYKSSESEFLAVKERALAFLNKA